MTTGILFYRGRARILDADGAPVSGAKLSFFLTGTTTPTDTYTDSDLSVAHANPVVADADGFVDPIYLDPAKVHKCVITDADDVALPDGTVDPVYGPMSPDVATQSSGSFTGTLTGMSSATTGTVDYEVVQTLGGSGLMCVLRVPTAITGTSNATSMTMTGLPAAVQPAEAVFGVVVLTDNNASVIGAFSIAGAGSTIIFRMGSGLSSSGFTSSSTKGLPAGTQIMYGLGS